MPTIGQKMDKFGLTKRQAKILRFLYRHDGDFAEAILIGREIYQKAKDPGRTVSFACAGLMHRQLVKKPLRGCYALTDAGRKLVEEINA